MTFLLVEILRSFLGFTWLYYDITLDQIQARFVWLERHSLTFPIAKNASSGPHSSCAIRMNIHTGQGDIACQGHTTDCFGRISVRKTCNRLNVSVWEMSSRTFLIKIN